MKQEFLLPDLGEGLTEAEIVQWLVAEGDTVTLNQTLAEVETAKAIVELPSPHAGVITSLHAAAGDVVLVGAPLVGFEIEGQDAPAPEAPASTAEVEEGSGPNLVGYGAAPSNGRPQRRARRAGAGSVASTTTVAADADVRVAAPHDDIAVAPAPPVRGERPRSTPPVRAYAKGLGVDLVLVAAELGDRVITRADVDAYRERLVQRGDGQTAGTTDAPAPVATPVRAATGERATTRIPVRGVRKHTAEAMVQSAFSAPHVTTFYTVDVTATSELIASLRATAKPDAPRIGVLTVVAKAVCLALASFPGLNARWDGEAGEIVQQHFVDLGIAAATERGLIVPIIRDAERMPLGELAAAVAELTRTARSGKTPPADLIGGTFSLTNIGVFGIDAGTPILPPGQTGILALGAVRRLPWEHKGEIALRDIMTLSLSFDHRIVDGAEGAQFLMAVADVLQEPGRAMLLG
ncbi:dihydrolipoamide acetyltransferase family protein [Microbacterium sp. 13-71-7]|jgi:pyruvate dehydrogenase E2 component (dihydrolipoamide acetyltransferase)|uniref:dihydrolipoamide acetyltransferase family protein n=1 Tax=Microbacterium sp. 13-71-7 TaxID=1970399 RepID=UPI000BD1F2C1|nr:dihydrolipoamide acetyltransferase family protein [Microbacterium sp. 13-71-7]OZB81385.1 MAG: dihydrolipoamide acyltransferase [Microbacterium sp. 13-71-7]